MKRNKIIFLIDGRTTFLKDFWVNKYFLENNYNYKFLGIDNLKQVDLDKRSRALILNFKYIISSLNAILQSSKGDLVIVWLDKMGIYSFIWSILLFRPRKLLILNIMAPNTNSISSKVRNFIYYLCLKNKNSYATVNNPELTDIYKKDLCIDGGNLFVLNDSIQDVSKLKEEYQLGQDYVFFGGSGGRDFDLIIEIAKRLPTIPFVFVVKKKYFKIDKEISRNVKIFYDTTLEEFNDKLSRSNLVVLPINVDTPAGILVLITAGLKSKMVITSNTPSIRNYISNNVNGILLENIFLDDWVSSINENFNNKHQQKRLGKKLQIEMLNVTSNQNYINQLENIIKSISKIKNFKQDENSAN